MYLNLESAYKIPGFMSAHELVDLHILGLQLPLDGKMVELGCWRGRSSYALWSGACTEDFTVVDTFGGTPGEETAFEDCGLQAMIDFTNNMMDRFDSVPNIIRGDSTESAIKFKDGSVDFLFIDGDHSTEKLEADIRAWIPKIRSQGLMAGHDYDRETVKRAFANVFKHPPVLNITRTIWMTVILHWGDL